MSTDYQLERGMPVSIEAERSIIGSVLLENALYDEAAEYLTGDEFSLDAHRRIWRRMRELREANKPIDMILLCEELDRHKEIEAIGGVAYLSSLIDGLPDRPSVKHYVAIVRSKALLRGLIGISQTAIAEAIENAEEPEEVLARAELAITQLSENVIERKWSTFADSVVEAGGLDGYLGQILDPVAITGLPTGYQAIDSLIGGLPKANLIVVAARPSVGKTSFCLNVVENVLLRVEDAVVAVFSLEMSKRALESRILASMARVDIKTVVRERASQLDWHDDSDNRKVGVAVGHIVDKRLFIDDSSYLTPIRLRSKCRQLKRKEGRLDLVAVDYLQLMSGGAKFENRTQEVSAISRSLKGLAKDLDCPVMALSQLSRSVEGRSDKTPMLSDLKESGSIEQDSDIVMFIHRPCLYDPDPDLEGMAEINVAKNRDGATGKRKLAFLASVTRFENLAMEG